MSVWVVRHIAFTKRRLCVVVGNVEVQLSRHFFFLVLFFFFVKLNSDHANAFDHLRECTISVSAV